MTIRIEGIYPSTVVCSLIGGQRGNISEFRMDGVNGCHKFVFVKKGSGRLMIDGKTQGYGPNTLIFIPDHCPHTLEIGVNAAAIAIAIPAALNVVTPIDPIVVALENTGDIASIMQLFETALSEYNSGEPGALMAIESYIGLMTVHAQRLASFRSHDEKRSAAENLMRRFANLVEQDFHTGKNINAYASELGITPTHLTRVCQHLNGVSASQFLQQRILSESKHLLSVTDQKINQLSEMLGFTTPAYFSRFFHERCGQSPKDFRAQRKA